MALTSVAAQGQIWYVYPDVDDNMRTRRMKKIRPWLIISPDKANFSTSSYIGFPITHTANYNDEFRIHIECPTKPGKAYSKSWIIPYKPREIDEHDLLGYLGAVDPSIVSQCIESFHQYLLGNITNKAVSNSFMNIDEFVYDGTDNIINVADITYRLDILEDYHNSEIIKEEESKNESINELSDDDRLYLKLHPKVRYYNKYKDITSSITISEYIALYKHNKQKFVKEFNISSKSAKILYNELLKYYDWLLQKVMEEAL